MTECSINMSRNSHTLCQWCGHGEAEAGDCGEHGEVRVRMIRGKESRPRLPQRSVQECHRFAVSDGISKDGCEQRFVGQAEVGSYIILADDAPMH